MSTIMESSAKLARHGATRGESAQVAAIGASIESRLLAYDWEKTVEHLDANGWATLEGILSAEECRRIAALYEGGGNSGSRS